MLAVEVGHNAGGAAHHVAVAEGEVQSAGRAAVLLEDDLAGAVQEASAVLHEQKDKERGGGEHGVHGDGDPHVAALVAGGGEHTLADVAGEHDDKDNNDIRYGLDDTLRAGLEVSGKVPDLVVDTHEALHGGHPQAEEGGADQADYERLTDVGPVELAALRGQAEVGGGYHLTRCLAAIGADSQTDEADEAHGHEQPEHDAVQVLRREYTSAEEPVHAPGGDLDKEERRNHKAEQQVDGPGLQAALLLARGALEAHGALEEVELHEQVDCSSESKHHGHAGNAGENLLRQPGLVAVSELNRRSIDVVFKLDDGGNCLAAYVAGLVHCAVNLGIAQVTGLAHRRVGVGLNDKVKAEVVGNTFAASLGIADKS